MWNSVGLQRLPQAVQATQPGQPAQKTIRQQDQSISRSLLLFPETFPVGNDRRAIECRSLVTILSHLIIVLRAFSGCIGSLHITAP
jgi:hypothetical protein